MLPPCLLLARVLCLICSCRIVIQAAFVEGELQHAQLQQVKKPNLPSFDLPPPPSPPRNVRMIPGSDSRSTDSIDKSGGRRVRSMASLSQEELVTLAASRAPFQSPLPELPKVASVSSPFATTASELPQFTAYAPWIIYLFIYLYYYS